MDEERVVKQYTHAIRTTRASIGDTLDQLRDRVREATDWRHYVERYPAASLGLAIGIGLVGGRFVGDAVNLARPGPRRRDDRPRAARSIAADEPRLDEAPAAPVGAVRTIGGRAGTRLEAIAVRLVDEMASSLEAAVVPAVLTSFQRLLGGGEPRAMPGRRDRVA
jgi:hypothetical protein